MADELNSTATLSYTNGSDTEAKTLSGLATVGSAQRASPTQNIASSWEQVDQGPLTNPGVIFIENLESGKYLEISFDGGSTVYARIGAGDWNKITAPNGTTAIHAQFQTSAGNARFWIFDA